MRQLAITRGFLFVLALIPLLVPAPGCAATHLLFDGSLGTLPYQQGLLFLSTPISDHLSSQTLTPTGVELDSTAKMQEKAGYFPKAAGIILDRKSGFALELEIALWEETHSSNDRAGLSLILLSHDLRGVELGIWKDEIWAQTESPLFKHGEGAPIPGGSNELSIRVEVAGDSYTVWVNSIQTLEGKLKDYSAFGSPYNLADLYFIGDDTSSALARVELRRMALVN